jgi:hypothetical protein
MTILTHGFLKGAPVKAEFKKAKRIRDQYNREVEDGRT